MSNEACDNVAVQKEEPSVDFKIKEVLLTPFEKIKNIYKNSEITITHEELKLPKDATFGTPRYQVSATHQYGAVTAYLESLEFLPQFTVYAMEFIRTKMPFGHIHINDRFLKYHSFINDGGLTSTIKHIAASYCHPMTLSELIKESDRDKSSGEYSVFHHYPTLDAHVAFDPYGHDRWSNIGIDYLNRYSDKLRNSFAIITADAMMVIVSDAPSIGDKFITMVDLKAELLRMQARKERRMERKNKKQETQVNAHIWGNSEEDSIEHDEDETDVPTQVD